MNSTPQDVRLSQLIAGARFSDLVCAFRSPQVRTSKNGQAFLSVQLRDCSGTRQARWFNVDGSIIEELKEAQLVKVSGIVDSSPGPFYGHIRLDSCAPQEAPDDLTPFLEPLPQDHQGHKMRFFALIRSVQNDYCKQLLASIFRPGSETWEVFEKAPAAKAMHHAWRGGLLEHTAEVAALCSQSAGALPFIDVDLLLTGALLHDIGKIDELAQDLNSGDYTQPGQLIGHVVQGTMLIKEAINNIEDFPTDLRDELLHLVLSHHGRTEFGAVKTPMFPEAVILSLCDLMSARVAQCRDYLQKNQGDDFTRDIFGWDTPQVYLKSMKRMMEESQ